MYVIVIIVICFLFQVLCCLQQKSRTTFPRAGKYVADNSSGAGQAVSLSTCLCALVLCVVWTLGPPHVARSCGSTGGEAMGFGLGPLAIAYCDLQELKCLIVIMMILKDGDEHDWDDRLAGN